MAKTKRTAGKKSSPNKAAPKAAANKAGAKKAATKKASAKSAAAKKPAPNKPAPNKPAPKKPARKLPAVKAAAKPSSAKAKPIAKPSTAKAAKATLANPISAPPPTTPEIAAFSFSDADLDSIVFEAAVAKPDASAFAPGTLVEHKGGTYSVVYSKFPESPDLAAVYDERGLQGGGYTWHGFVVHLLKQHAPEALPALEFDPEGSMFCAVSKDLSALRAVGAALAKLEDIELVKELARTVDVSEYD